MYKGGGSRLSHQCMHAPAIKSVYGVIRDHIHVLCLTALTDFRVLVSVRKEAIFKLITDTLCGIGSPFKYSIHT